MTDYTDLKARLRSEAETAAYAIEPATFYLEAAAAIEQLEAERDALREAAQIGRGYISAAIEDWGVDDAHSQSMKADLAQVDAALTAAQ